MRKITLDVFPYFPSITSTYTNRFYCRDYRLNNVDISGYSTIARSH
jgi:hypothetical protein